MACVTNLKLSSIDALALSVWSREFRVGRVSHSSQTNLDTSQRPRLSVSSLLPPQVSRDLELKHIVSMSTGGLKSSSRRSYLHHPSIAHRLDRGTAYT